MSAYDRNTLIVGVVAALVIGGAVSYFASPDPDGLEKTQEELGAAEPVHGGVTVPPLVFDEYNLRGLGDGFWANAAAGVVGSLLVMGVLLAVGRVLHRRGSAVADAGRGAATRP